eukprot:CAMPEP_0171716296 /NCGR_PEP_ID=MMETSP0991-20121206/19377_1 /TAXON_ID=483369 /ORGANISM="non described non described, Strain CCMP2098" /LENGTH=385 /DNA_ID=CAMNT_0012307343 /DNA_START=49 /DNA_END=1206 /DNA_ORIENTATION=+
MNPAEQIPITPGIPVPTAVVPSIEHISAAAPSMEQHVPTVMPLPPGVYSNFNKQVNLFALGGNANPTTIPVSVEGGAPVKRTSNYVGVHWHRGANKWVAQISIACKRTHLGYFATEYEAALRYDVKAQELGRPLNFPSNSEQGNAEQATKVNALIVGPSIDFTKGPYKKQKKVRDGRSLEPVPWGIGNEYDLQLSFSRVMSMSSQTDFQYTCLPNQVEPPPLVLLPTLHRNQHHPSAPPPPSSYRMMPKRKQPSSLQVDQESMIFQFNPQPLDAEKIMKALLKQQAGKPKPNLPSNSSSSTCSNMSSNTSSNSASNGESSSLDNNEQPTMKSNCVASILMDMAGNADEESEKSNDPFALVPAAYTCQDPPKYNDNALKAGKIRYV